jgi:hypothetical protein
VVARERLDSFGERVIDLSRVIEARTLGELEAAGHELAEL